MSLFFYFLHEIYIYPIGILHFNFSTAFFCEIIMFSVSSKKEGMAKEEMWQYPMAMVVHFFFFPKHIKFHWTWVE